MAHDVPFGAKIIPKYILWVRGLVPFYILRHSFLSLTDCWWLYNIQLKTSREVLFLPPSDAYVRSFLYLLYTLIKLCYTKAPSGQALSLAPDGNPRGQESRHRSQLTASTYHLGGLSRIPREGVSFHLSPANLDNSAGAIGLEKVSLHSNSRERQCQRML